MLETDDLMAGARLRDVAAPIFQGSAVGQHQVGHYRGIVEERGEADDVQASAIQRIAEAQRTGKPMDWVNAVDQQQIRLVVADIGNRLLPLGEGSFLGGSGNVF